MQSLPKIAAAAQNNWHPRASSHGNAAMLDVRDLRKSFAGPEGARVEVVRIPRFSLAVGEERALRGESGCGKTTFLNLVAGILAADSGTIGIDGTDMVSLPEA